MSLYLIIKKLFNFPKSQVYINGFRKAMIYDGRKCQYPKNYDQLIKLGKIEKIKKYNKKPKYYLKYKGYKFDLTLIKKIDNNLYFTISFLVNKNRYKINDYRKFYEPFLFKKEDLKKYIPILEVKEIFNSKYPSFKLTDSHVPIKKNKEKKIYKITGQKEKNGKLLYNSYFKKLNISFYEIRDQNGNLELDKSLISVPIIFIANLTKTCVRILTSIPMELGKYLINKQNSITKTLGYFLFITSTIIKNFVNLGTTIFKIPILLLVTNKKKYDDAYWIMWKFQIKECWKEIKNDYSIVKFGGEKLKLKENSYYPEYRIMGTQKELDNKEPNLEKKLKDISNKINEINNIEQRKNPKKLQNEKINKEITFKNSIYTPYTTLLYSRRVTQKIKNLKIPYQQL
ncbi:MAG: hypothetical protein LJI21_02610 [Wolbachia endosymbiont of Menacanthus eurysternus]|nr:MAG: hypothetical protein LJI21_02610 [Wolbachia endosymbiont of Menacanthus eurysternus]